MGVDSYEFPARNYGDLAFRTWGTTARHVVNFIQSIALLLLLGQVTILFGLNINEMAKFTLCVSACSIFRLQDNVVPITSCLTGTWLICYLLIVHCLPVDLRPRRFLLDASSHLEELWVVR